MFDTKLNLSTGTLESNIIVSRGGDILKNYMYYILISIYFLLFLLHPYFVSRYLTLDVFLLSWLLFVDITAIMIKLIFWYLKKSKT